MIEAVLNTLNNLLGTSYFAKCAIVFIVSMLPIVELRGAIPIGVGVLDLPIYATAIISLLGNMLPVPFIIIFTRRVFGWMRKKNPHLRAFADRLERKVKSKGARLYRSELIGLIVFVAIPLPGTGAWTGAMIAALFDIRLKAAFPAIFVGVFIAGIIVMGLTYGFKSILF